MGAPIRPIPKNPTASFIGWFMLSGWRVRPLLHALIHELLPVIAKSGHSRLKFLRAS